MTPPNVLERARAFLGWTQEEMAESLGVSRSTYQRREALADEAIPPPEKTHARALVGAWAIDEVFDDGGEE